MRPNSHRDLTYINQFRTGANPQSTKAGEIDT